MPRASQAWPEAEPEQGQSLPFPMLSRGRSGSWPPGPFSVLPLWVAAPQGSCSSRGTRLLQLLVDRANSGCLTRGLQGRARAAFL